MSTSRPSRTTRAVFGAQAHQPRDRRRGAALRARLQPAPEQDERDDDHRRLEVDGRPVAEHVVVRQVGAANSDGQKVATVL